MENTPFMPFFNLSQANTVAQSAFWNSVSSFRSLLYFKLKYEFGVPLPEGENKFDIKYDRPSGLSFGLQTGHSVGDIELRCSILTDERMTCVLFSLNNTIPRESWETMFEEKLMKTESEGGIYGKYFSLEEFEKILPDIAEVLKKVKVSN